MRSPALLRLAVPLTAALAGCFVDNAPVLLPPGDESSTGTTTGAPGDETGDATTGGPLIGDSHGGATTTGATPDTTGATTDTTGATPDTTTAAATIADPTDPTDPAPTCADLANGSVCLECACRACADAFAACQADRGCVAIMACAVEHGCLGTDCLDPCADVINEYGGPSTTTALTLSVCAQDECMC